MLMFDRYIQKILSYLLKSRKALGEIVAYFGRVEFQGRGSPHNHMTVKCSDAPILGVDSIQDVIAYIDKYTSTYLPTEEHDVQLRNLVKLQVHKHTNTSHLKKKHVGSIIQGKYLIEQSLLMTMEMNLKTMKILKNVLVGKLNWCIVDTRSMSL